MNGHLDSYRAWRSQVRQELIRPDPLPPLPQLNDNPLVNQLGRLVYEVRRVVGIIGRTMPQAFAGSGVRDRNKYSSVLAMLDRIVEFQSFSLAEYVYHLPDGRPGARLLLEERDWIRRAAVVFFENVGQWRVDWQGNRISHELLAFDLSGPDPRPLISPWAAEYYQSDWSWQEHLEEAFCLPVRLTLLPD